MAPWKILKSAIRGYIAHEALTRGAAIAFYAVTSLAPVLFVVVAIAGLVFGEDLVRSNLVDQVSGLVGKEGGELIKTMLSRAADKESSIWASILGVLTVIVTASGVFGELQTALNRTWEVENSSDQPWFSIIRARAVSLGLVAVLGFLLMISLAASAAISALGNYLGGQSGFTALLSVLNTGLSLALFTILFGAIYKVLPDTPLSWREVAVGAFLTAILFTVGKSLIGWYLGTTAAGSGYGAAGALILILLWGFYSSQILLLGAEITRAIAHDETGNAKRKKAVRVD